MYLVSDLFTDERKIFQRGKGAGVSWIPNTQFKSFIVKIQPAGGSFQSVNFDRFALPSQEDVSNLKKGILLVFMYSNTESIQFIARSKYSSKILHVLSTLKSKQRNNTEIMVRVWKQVRQPLLYLNPGSFLIQGKVDDLLAAAWAAQPKRNPFFARSIAGCTRSFQGNLPYLFQALRNPLTSPGTPDADGPVPTTGEETTM